MNRLPMIYSGVHRSNHKFPVLLVLMALLEYSEYSNIIKSSPLQVHIPISVWLNAVLHNLSKRCGRIRVKMTFSANKSVR